MKRLFCAVALLLSSSLMIVLAACTQQAAAQTQTVSFHRIAPLVHSPVGTADLSWNATNQVLVVSISVTGLAPNSMHPEHIHAGLCTRTPMGAILSTLTPLQADAHGVGRSETTITGVMGGIPASGWSVNIHNGPTLATNLQARPIACGTISRRNVSLASNQQARLTLLGTTAPDENVQGIAQLALAKDTLTVTLTLSGLVPYRMHLAHIHAGSCTSEGPVVFALQPIVADAQGHATATTVIRNVTNFAGSGDSLNVHEAGTMVAMSTTQGVDPIACGSIA